MKIKFILALFIITWLTLVVRVFFLAVESNTYYKRLSHSNTIKIEQITPVRGEIVDRNNRPIAINKLGFKIQLRPHLYSKKNMKIFKDKFKEILTEIRLKKNNEFAIKEVYDDASFQENAKVVKEVVELLQVYQIRYNYRQQFLSDFFELLLTTGLKQESGQFFTPVPIARFIIKSLPLQEITKTKIEEGNKNDLLPTIY